MKKTIGYILLSAVIWLLQPYAARVFGTYEPGPYLGVGVEYQRLMADQQDFIMPLNKPLNQYIPHESSYSDKGGIEGFFGSLYPYGDRFLVGWEGYASIDFNRISAEGDTMSVLKRSTLERFFNLGMLFRGGAVVYDDYFFYGLVGVDVGFFKWIQSEVKKDTSSQHGVSPGMRFGLGFERDFNGLRLGFQVDYIYYSSRLFSTMDATKDTYRSCFNPNVLNVGLRISIPLDLSN